LRKSRLYQSCSVEEEEEEEEDEEEEEKADVTINKRGMCKIFPDRKKGPADTFYFAKKKKKFS
jgi:hypothetical protein